MRLRLLLLFFLLVGACFAWACSLNPQPLPPDTFDSGKGAADASFNGDAATFGPDAGSTPDDGALPESGDASDASEDVTEDVSDSSDADDADDAKEDANASDAGIDE